MEIQAVLVSFSCFLIRILEIKEKKWLTSIKLSCRMGCVIKKEEMESTIHLSANSTGLNLRIIIFFILIF